MTSPVRAAPGPWQHGSRRTRLRTGAILGSVAAIGPLTVDLYIAALPTISLDLGAPAAAVQLTLTGSLVGLACGQLLVGPMSDAWGRRRPLLLALTGYLLTSLLCAAAPTVGVLVAARAAQGLAGGAALVLMLAVVRDLCSGRDAARLLSRLTLISGVAPVVAPSVGSLVLRSTSWRGVFALLSLAGAVLLVAVLRGLPETLPEGRRTAGSLRATCTSASRLLRDPLFVGLGAAGGLLLAAMFAYIAESPFVFQDEMGLSAQQFGVVFGVNAAGIVVGGQANAWLLHRVRRLETVVGVAVPVMAVGAACVLTSAVTGWFGLWGLNVPILVMMLAMGFAMPTSTALAMAAHPDLAGSAAALLGSSRFLTAGLSAPVVGLVAGTGAFPMAAVMVATTGSAVLVLAVLGATRRRRDPLGRAGGERACAPVSSAEALPDALG